MVIRCVVGGPSPRFSLLVAMLALPALGLAQAPSPNPATLEGQPPAAETVEVPTTSAQPSADSVQDEVVVYGKIVADTAPLRCWSSAVATPPAFDDVLQKDQVVVLGRSENGYREVILPIGPLGYVSKRFTQTDDNGAVSTKGTKVSFRYRPRTSEAPVAQMPDGTKMFVVSLEDGWYKARIQGVEAWVAEAQIQVVPSDPEVIVANEALAQQMQAVVQARLDLIAAELQQQERDRVDLEAVKLVEEAFSKELLKPVEKQQFGPLRATLAKVSAELVGDGAARRLSVSLKKRLETQQWIVDATAARSEKPPVVDATTVKPPVKDRMDRFESIGWLRYESRLSGAGIYYLEKGGRRQHLLSCNTGRFDLSLFVGREVGVIGPRRTPIAEQLSVLDVERIEVLGAERN